MGGRLMGDIAKRIVGPTQLGTAAATVYTVPASTTTILRHIKVCNESSSAVSFTLSIGADAAGKRLYYQVSIPGNGVLDWSGFEILAAAETLQSYASASTSLTLTLSGVEAT